jgi:hypothetical protein
LWISLWTPRDVARVLHLSLLSGQCSVDDLRGGEVAVSKKKKSKKKDSKKKKK